MLSIPVPALLSRLFSASEVVSLLFSWLELAKLTGRGLVSTLWGLIPGNFMPRASAIPGEGRFGGGPAGGEGCERGERGDPSLAKSGRRITPDDRVPCSSSGGITPGVAVGGTPVGEPPPVPRDMRGLVQDTCRGTSRPMGKTRRTKAKESSPPCLHSHPLHGRGGS